MVTIGSDIFLRARFVWRAGTLKLSRGNVCMQVCGCIIVCVQVCGCMYANMDVRIDFEEELKGFHEFE